MHQSIAPVILDFNADRPLEQLVAIFSDNLCKMNYTVLYTISDDALGGVSDTGTYLNNMHVVCLLETAHDCGRDGRYKFSLQRSTSSPDHAVC